MKPQPKTKDEIQGILRQAIDDAVDFVASTVAHDRVKAQRYYNGEVDIGHEEGRSSVVATKCRDTVRALKPSLMRVFFQTDKPVEFVPRRPEEAQGAEQATAYAHHLFQKCNGFRLLHDAMHDAMVKKTGILKVYHEDAESVEIDEYTGLTDEEFAFVAGDDDVELLEHTEREEQTDYGPVRVHDAKVSRTTEDGQIRIVSVPPEDFFIDREATSLADAYVCGHSSDARVGDLVAMGFDFETVAVLDDNRNDTSEQEEFARRRYSDFEDDESAADPSMKRVLLTEAYMRMDIEGTGVPRMYRFICGGGNYELLDYELCDDMPFAVFEVDPEPHAFFGKSLVELVIADQDAATALIRGLLDNVAMINNPGLVVLEGPTGANMDDVLNNEIGRVIRTRDMNAIREMAISPIGVSVLPALEYYDALVENKTGVTRASMGLDPDALQSTTAAGVNATVQAAAGQAEVIARHLAEGGMTQLFRLILKLVRKHAKAEDHMRIGGSFVPVDPRGWRSDMDVTVNVGLGTGQKEQRMLALEAVRQDQAAIWQTYGPSNGLVSMTQMRNVRADLLSMQGVKNADRYYAPMDEETESMLLQQAAQQAAQQQGGDPNAAYLQAEQMKVQARQQVDMAKLQIEAQKAMAEEMRKRMEMAGDDDLARDRMAQDLILEAARIAGEYGARVNVAALQQQQAAPRQYGQ